MPESAIAISRLLTWWFVNHTHIGRNLGLQSWVLRGLHAHNVLNGSHHRWNQDGHVDGGSPVVAHSVQSVFGEYLDASQGAVSGGNARTFCKPNIFKEIIMNSAILRGARI